MAVFFLCWGLLAIGCAERGATSGATAAQVDEQQSQQRGSPGNINSAAAEDANFIPGLFEEDVKAPQSTSTLTEAAQPPASLQASSSEADFSDAQAVRPPQGVAPDSQNEGLSYVYKKSTDPAGTGKFFMGREIAHFMTYHGADWLMRPEREQEEQPEKMLEVLDLQPGDTVADLGAGSGYLALRLARRVGPKGRVLAVEIQPEMIELLQKNQQEAGLENIIPILGTVTDPKLPAGTVDLVLMVDVYHEFSHPVEMMREIRRALKREGRVAFVEFRAEDPEVPIKRLHKMSEAQVRKEAEALGLKWQKTVNSLPWQHVVVFGNQPLRAKRN